MTRRNTLYSAKCVDKDRRSAGRKNTVNTQILDAPGELFLGSDVATAFALGSRHFRSAAKAVRFAMEHAAPVSLRGAMLKVGDKNFGPTEIKQFHHHLLAANSIRHASGKANS
jgi:hypothetical protein